MKTTLHKSTDRGVTNFGWLDSKHSFSFGRYFNPEKTNFGLLRVLNDDIVEPKMGFGTHAHDNMEIISIPIHGSLRHRDNQGHEGLITANEIQVMSAGSGIEHSEFNNSKDHNTNFLQIWIFPNKENVEPRYDQLKIPTDIKNKFFQILSPNPDDKGVWIHQQAWMHIADFTEAKSIDYHLKNQKNGVYVFIIEGEASIENQTLTKRDALGVWETSSFSVKAKPNTRILSIEIPMN